MLPISKINDIKAEEYVKENCPNAKLISETINISNYTTISFKVVCNNEVIGNGLSESMAWKHGFLNLYKKNQK